MERILQFDKRATLLLNYLFDSEKQNRTNTVLLAETKLKTF